MTNFSSFEELFAAIPDINWHYQPCFHIGVNYGPFSFAMAVMLSGSKSVKGDRTWWEVRLFVNCRMEHGIAVESYDRIWVEECDKKELHNDALHRLLTREITKMIEITKDDPFPFDAIEPPGMYRDGIVQTRLDKLKEEYKKELRASRGN